MPKFLDITGQQFNEWTVLEYIGKSYWKCQCSCGKICNKTSYSIIHGVNKSCGHSVRDKLEGMTFGSLYVINYNNNGTYTCRCKCGNVIVAKAHLLRNGSTHECKECRYSRNKNTLIKKYGETSTNRISNPREKWQLHILSDRTIMKQWLLSFKRLLYIYEISDKLNTSKGEIRKTIREYNLEDYTMIGRELVNSSNKEKDVLTYIVSIYNGNIIENDRKVIYPKELDIYIPEKRVAIEFNGNYYHSHLYKDTKYHQDKTLKCYKNGVRLIHIFEYEWDNNSDKIKKLIEEIICGTQKIYARNTSVVTVNNEDAKTFFSKYHIDGYSKAAITIGLKYDNSIISMMSFASPRFNREYQYEIIRYATIHGVNIVGGTSKLLKHFIKSYKVESILTYVDISKFSGNSYSKAGMTLCKDCITNPGYVWVNSNNEVLQRYQTQKHKLLKQELGNVEQTENEIMTDLGYYKIYDSGNLKLEWKRNKE